MESKETEFLKLARDRQSAAQRKPDPPILIVDDGSETRTLHTELLQRNGYEVVAVADGAAALAAVEAQHFDLVITKRRQIIWKITHKSATASTPFYCT